MAARLSRSAVALRHAVRASSSAASCRLCASRGFASSTTAPKTKPSKQAELLKAWQQYRGVDDIINSGAQNVHVGFLSKKRTVSKQLAFADLTIPSGETIQICSNALIDEEGHAKFRQIPAFSPVVIETRTPTADEQSLDTSSKPTVYLDSIRSLNSVPKDLIVTPEVVFPPNKRHLQLRFHPELHARLEFRSWLKNMLHTGLMGKGFTDVETPTLFKSTSEGAREFLVPTRLKGKAYALTQSPQQYKQILMGGGVSRYMQWARCYRDEDLRADRQPEFSQLDMEWAFAGSATVRKDITDIVLQALENLKPATTYQDIRGERVPMIRDINLDEPAGPPAHRFTNLTFAECIESYGTDKPDLRIPNKIHAIADLEPYRQFVGMITHLPNPRIEGFAFHLENSTPEESRKLVFEFMESLPAAIGENPDGKPQALVFDTSKPLCGFSSLGFEFEAVLDQLTEGQELNDGDIVIFQARPEPEGQYCSASTKIGDTRTALWNRLVEAGQLTKPRLGDPESLQFLWVTEFPMFKPSEEGEPGQGGAAGIAASHHPFTAPLSEKDLELLFTSPLDAKSAAYDLVLNGVEIGGGSERIHISAVQEFIMRDILLMDDARVKDFGHLFSVLESGCPPHAGFALGFDRFVALLSGTNSVRDVIAFPKTMKGEDLFVKSPGKITNEQLAPYHLRIGANKE